MQDLPARILALLAVSLFTVPVITKFRSAIASDESGVAQIVRALYTFALCKKLVAAHLSSGRIYDFKQSFLTRKSKHATGLIATPLNKR